MCFVFSPTDLTRETCRVFVVPSFVDLDVSSSRHTDTGIGSFGLPSLAPRGLTLPYLPVKRAATLSCLLLEHTHTRPDTDSMCRVTSSSSISRTNPIARTLTPSGWSKQEVIDKHNLRTVETPGAFVARSGLGRRTNVCTHTHAG